MNEYSFVAKVEGDPAYWVADADEAENGVREAIARWGYQVGDVRGLTYHDKEDTWTGFVDCSSKHPFRAAYNGVAVKLSR
jgi:hypothetical protein